MEETPKTKRWLKWVLAIATAAAAGSCAITITNVNHSDNAQIKNEQNATQQNDSTNFNITAPWNK